MIPTALLDLVAKESYLNFQQDSSSYIANNGFHHSVVVAISILIPVLGIGGVWLWFRAEVFKSGVVGIGEKARVLWMDERVKEKNPWVPRAGVWGAQDEWTH